MRSSRVGVVFPPPHTPRRLLVSTDNAARHKPLGIRAVHVMRTRWYIGAMRTIENGVAVERLRELFAYDTETGRLIRNVSGRGPGAKAGTVVGCPDTHGYLRVGVDGTRLPVHRCVWAIAHGYWPEHCIDHVNGIRDDNRLSNLRLADVAKNAHNKKCQATKRIPLKGVRMEPSGSFRARICVNGRSVHLGTFPTAELAHSAYHLAAARFFGEFARSR